MEITSVYTHTHGNILKNISLYVICLTVLGLSCSMQDLVL